MNTLLILASLILLLVFGFHKRSKVAKNKFVRAVVDNCVGCQLCIKRCSAKALDMEEHGNEKRIVINPDKCTTCKNCIAVCRFNALELVNRKQTENQQSF
ncbi:NADH-quinone oxidoreductase subunit I [Anaerosporobacter sp.]|uniref:NADH-quinone oxidoreductase subunit I n=1 Tax=Anaerosporobacter sp. TaxID=1872529 RepID=UPI003FA42EA3